MERKNVIEISIWVLAVTACLLAIAVLAHAELQKGEPPPLPTPEEMIERLQKDFNLTEDQTAKVRKFMNESVRQEEEVFKRYGLNREQFQVLRKDLHMAKDDFFKKMDSILTEEQKKICGPGRAPMNGHRPPPLPSPSYKPFEP